MLNNFKNILKTMSKAFKFSDEGEMLDYQAKIKKIGNKTGSTTQNTAFKRLVLAGEEEFSIEAIEREIALCKENNLMLDLLCVTSKNSNGTSHLSAAWVLLE